MARSLATMAASGFTRYGATVGAVPCPASALADDELLAIGRAALRNRGLDQTAADTAAARDLRLDATDRGHLAELS